MKKMPMMTSKIKHIDHNYTVRDDVASLINNPHGERSITFIADNMRDIRDYDSLRIGSVVEFEYCEKYNHAHNVRRP